MKFREKTDPMCLRKPRWQAGGGQGAWRCGPSGHEAAKTGLQLPGSDTVPLPYSWCGLQRPNTGDSGKTRSPVWDVPKERVAVWALVVLYTER